MRAIFILILLVCFSDFAYSSMKNDQLLKRLNDILLEKGRFVADKEARIQKLRKRLTTETTIGGKYEVYQKLYNEYKSFRYDSAYTFSKKLLKIALEINDRSKIARSEMAVSFTLLSSGMFYETLATLDKVNTRVLPDTAIIEYYFLKGRCYFDWADFNHNEDYSRDYREKAILYIDSALAIAKPYSYYYYTLLGLKNLRLEQYQKSALFYEKALSLPGIAAHEFAVTGSTLSYVYEALGKQEISEALLIRAAIADLMTATKETVAIYKLADDLYKKGDAANAYICINEAIDEAKFYGARHRQVMISNILPIIESQRIRAIEEQRHSLIIYSSIITLLVMAIIIFAIIIKLQLKKLREADAVIQSANLSLKETNKQLEAANNNLSIANKIKNEYIGHYFKINSVYLEKLENIKSSLERKLKNHLYEDAMSTLKSIDLDNERNQLFNTFDKVFLGLFPNFTNQFNDLFNPKDAIPVPNGHLLSSEHRIFALIRMGIQDADRIAKLMGFTVNTIYTYKTRVKTKSIIPNDEFEEIIMGFQPV
jgi:hypothetical protein